MKNGAAVNVPSRPPAITQVCQQLRSESLPVYLGRNDFAVTIHSIRSKLLNDWLSVLGSKKLQHLRKLIIEFHVQATPLSRDFPFTFYAEFEPWHDLVFLFYDMELKPSQLGWAGLPRFLDCDRWSRGIGHGD